MSEFQSPAPIYTAIDSGRFYVTTTSRAQGDVNAYIDRLHSLCTSALLLGAELRAAAAAGVTQAQAVVDVFETVEAFSDEAKAAAFLSALLALKSG